MEWSDVLPHLTGLAHLATVRPDGRPHVSVVATAIEGETVWIGTSRSSRTARNLAERPAASIMWRPGAEVYVDADVELVDDLDTKRRLWDGGVFPYDPSMFFGTVDDPDFVLLRLSPRAAVLQTMGRSGPRHERWTA